MVSNSIIALDLTSTAAYTAATYFLGEFMNKKTLTATLLVGLFLTSTAGQATGFVKLPATGFTIKGGISAYIGCNLTGNFGTNPNGSTPPSFSPANGANNFCAIPSITPPMTGYQQTATTVRNLVMNNAYTLRLPITVGTLTDTVWRKDKQCIYGTKIRLNNVDYDRRAVSPGFQYFEINDVLRGGLKTSAPLSIAYHYTTLGSIASDDVLYRAGLTYTSIVFQRGNLTRRPLTSLAPLSPNWVDFTTDINFRDDDGSSVRDSPWLLIKGSCTSTAPKQLAGALLFRQMGQEEQPLIEISTDAYAPSEGTIAP